MNKINWVNGTTKLNKDTMDTFQNNIENGINEAGVIVSATEPTTDRRKIWLQKGKNLYNKKDSIKDALLSGSDGTTYYASGYTSSGFILLKAGTYVFSNSIQHLCTYNISKTFIGILNITNQITLDSDVYIRFDFDTKFLDTMQLEQNTTSTPYEPYIEEKVWILNDNNVYEEFREKKENITTGVEYATNEYIDGKRVYEKYLDVPETTINSSSNCVIGFSYPVGLTMLLNLHATIYTQVSKYWYQINAQTSTIRLMGDNQGQIIVNKSDFGLEGKVLKGKIYMKYLK